MARAGARAAWPRSARAAMKRLGRWWRGSATVDESVIERLETELLLADTGTTMTARLLAAARAAAGRDSRAPAVRQALRDALLARLAPLERPLEIDGAARPFLVLMVGVNGVGKTTTAAKLARHFQRLGHSVLLAAGDTFRAAATEQLQLWAQRLDVPLVSQQIGADAAAVLHDALSHARAQRIDVVVADTAGRLHNRDELMRELGKIVKVLRKIDPQAPHETLLALDANTGQNMLRQLREFDAQIGVSGLALTKMDGSAKGGALFALADDMAVPVRFIGVGERVDDLRPFRAIEFIEQFLGEAP